MNRPIRIAFIVVDDRFDKDLPVPYFGPAPAALLKGFEELGGNLVEVHVISCLPRPLKCPEKLAENIWFHGEYVPKWGFLRTLHSGCVRAVRRMVDKIQPDIIHSQGSERWCAVSGAFLPYPKVITLHGVLRMIDPVAKLQPRPYWKLQTLLERIAVPRFDGLVCITSHTRRHMESLAKKTWIVPNASDLGFYEGDCRPVEPPVILYVGTIYKLKNQIGFVDALVPLAQRLKFVIRFCGNLDRNNEYGAELGERIDKYHWCESVGHLNREELKAELKSAAMLALVSKEENFGLVIVEAMAAGVPVVAGRIGGIPDIIEDGVNGLLCDPSDPASIREAVGRILEDRQLAAILSEEAKKMVHTRYTPAAVAAKHLEIYREVIGDRIETTSISQ